LDCGNRTGLVENEVTRRGNSTGEGKVQGENFRRRVERKGRGLEEKSHQIFVPARCRAGVVEKNRRIKRNSCPVTARESYSRRTRGGTLSSNLMISLFAAAFSDIWNEVFLDLCRVLAIKHVTDLRIHIHKCKRLPNSNIAD